MSEPLTREQFLDELYKPSWRADMDLAKLDAHDAALRSRIERVLIFVRTLAQVKVNEPSETLKCIQAEAQRVLKEIGHVQ